MPYTDDQALDDDGPAYDPPLAQHAAPYSDEAPPIESRHAAAILWLPSADSPTGWRDHYVDRPLRPQPTPTPIGLHTYRKR